MKVYFVYAVMSDEMIYESNCFGQYDRFRSSKKTENGMNMTLWGFTNKKRIMNEFLKERPVEKRYHIIDKEMDKYEYEYFVNDNFTSELIPIALDIRYNIGDKSGYFLAEDTQKIRTEIPKDKENCFVYRIMTIKDYSYMTSNLGEICSEYKHRIFNIFKLPVTANLFIPKYRNILNSFGFNVDAMTYHPDAITYMQSTNDAKEEFIAELTNNGEMHIDQSPKIDAFSVFQIFYITYAELIFKGEEYE